MPMFMCNNSNSFGRSTASRDVGRMSLYLGRYFNNRMDQDTIYREPQLWQKQGVVTRNFTLRHICVIVCRIFCRQLTVFACNLVKTRVELLQLKSVAKVVEDRENFSNLNILKEISPFLAI